MKSIEYAVCNMQYASEIQSHFEYLIVLYMVYVKSLDNISSDLNVGA